MNSFNSEQIIASAVLLVGFSLVVLAQDLRCSMKVKVFDAKSKVVLENADIRTINYDKRTYHYTSALEHELVENVPTGRISITVNREGYEENTYQTILNCKLGKKPSIFKVPLTLLTPVNKSKTTRVRTKAAQAIVPDKNNRHGIPLENGVVNGKARRLGRPSYPAAARAARITGLVKVKIHIDIEGNVISARAVSGHPLLRRASEKAAADSYFRVTQLSGKPVEVIGVIVYNFTP